MTLLLFLLACASSPGETGGGATTGDGGADPRWPDPALSLSGRVLDPTLDGDPALSVSVSIPDRAEVDCSVDLELVGAEGALRTAALTLAATDASVDWSFDGRDDQGEHFPPGPVDVRAWTDCADGSRGSSSSSLAVVRLAPAEIALSGEGKVPLAFHKLDLVTVGVTPIDRSEYRLAAGLFTDAAPTVAAWTDPDMPPWTDDPDAVARNLPAAFVVGSAPSVEVTPATDDDHGRALLPDGVTVQLLTDAGAVDWTAGILLDLEPVEASVGQDDRVLTWTWSACLDGDCATVPGSRQTVHHLYRLLGPSQLRDGGADGYADGTPWVGVLADTVDAVEGATDAAAVMDALRDRVNTDPWLVYDPSDSAYSDYEGSYIYWESITSQLSAWLDRRKGLHLYCHSVSCLLSTLAQSWGVDAEQIVLGVGFQTNLARAAGTETWGRWYFNSHSVATTDHGGTIWDAAVDLDGDDDPYNEPVDPVSPKGMDGAEYFWRLTYDDIGIVNSGKCFVE